MHVTFEMIDTNLFFFKQVALDLNKVTVHENKTKHKNKNRTNSRHIRLLQTKLCMHELV